MSSVVGRWRLPWSYYLLRTCTYYSHNEQSRPRLRLIPPVLSSCLAQHFVCMYSRAGSAGWILFPAAPDFPEVPHQLRYQPFHTRYPGGPRLTPAHLDGPRPLPLSGNGKQDRPAWSLLVLVLPIISPSPFPPALHILGLLSSFPPSLLASFLPSLSEIVVSLHSALPSLLPSFPLPPPRPPPLPPLRSTPSVVRSFRPFSHSLLCPAAFPTWAQWASPIAHHYFPFRTTTRMFLSSLPSS